MFMLFHAIVFISCQEGSVETGIVPTPTTPLFLLSVGSNRNIYKSSISSSEYIGTLKNTTYQNIRTSHENVSHFYYFLAVVKDANIPG